MELGTSNMDESHMNGTDRTVDCAEGDLANMKRGADNQNNDGGPVDCNISELSDDGDIKIYLLTSN